MKPKTKKQREIMSLVPKLTPISNKQMEYAEKYLFVHFAFKNGKQAYCMTCGKHLSENELKAGKCDSCGNSLKIVETKKRNDSAMDYYAIVSKCGKYQVVRYFFVKRTSVRKQEAKYWFSEVAQQWIDDNGKVEIVARRCRYFSYYSNDMYDHWSPMAIREKLYVSESVSYPKMSLIPVIRRNLGDRYKDICDLKRTSVAGAFLKVIQHPHAETLFKARQYELFEWYKEGFVERNWNVVKVCIRSKYVVKDFSLWRDMVEDMNFCGCDILNRKNVCPENLEQAHDYWLKRKQDLEEKNEKLKQEQKAKNYEEKYKMSKGKWFAIAIEANDISIKVLDSVSKFIEEANAMHHCVFSNEYYKKKNSLILSVRENGNRIATIEYDISKFKVLQCRGVCNQVPAHYDEILSIMDNHRKMFRKIAKSA